MWTSNNNSSYFETNAGCKLADVCTATWNSEINVLSRLVEQEKNMSSGSINTSSFAGFGPLHYAASLGNEQILVQLLDSGLCDKNARDKDGNTPLIWVVSSNGSDDLMEALVDHGADVNVQNYEGESALFIAAKRGYLDKLEYLLENGAKIQMRNIDGASPLHVAVGEGQIDSVMKLIQYGAYLNVGDDEDDTPLHWAVREGHKEIVNKLIECGADMNCVNADGESAIELAKTLGDEMEVVMERVVKGKEGVVGMEKGKVETMEVEMKGLNVEEKREEGYVRAFGSTPPMMSFVY